MSEDELKWELNLYNMMTISKYFKNNKDYINVMKVNKKYKQLVLMYIFNPIGDISLFENIETQHFYYKEDINNKKERLFKYIYWFNDVEMFLKRKDNETFKRIKIHRNKQKPHFLYIDKKWRMYNSGRS